MEQEARLGVRTEQHPLPARPPPAHHHHHHRVTPYHKHMQCTRDHPRAQEEAFHVQGIHVSLRRLHCTLHHCKPTASVEPLRPKVQGQVKKDLWVNGCRGGPFSTEPMSRCDLLQPPVFLQQPAYTVQRTAKCAPVDFGFSKVQQHPTPQKHQSFFSKVLHHACHPPFPPTPQCLLYPEPYLLELGDQSLLLHAIKVLLHVPIAFRVIASYSQHTRNQTRYTTNNY